MGVIQPCGWASAVAFNRRNPLYNREMAGLAWLLSTDATTLFNLALAVAQTLLQQTKYQKAAMFGH